MNTETVRFCTAGKKRKTVYHNNVLYHNLPAFPNLESSAVEQMYRLGVAKAPIGNGALDVSTQEGNKTKKGGLQATFTKQSHH
jgi:hypothetical protein